MLHKWFLQGFESMDKSPEEKNFYGEITSTNAGCDKECCLIGLNPTFKSATVCWRAFAIEFSRYHCFKPGLALRPLKAPVTRNSSRTYETRTPPSLLAGAKEDWSANSLKNKTFNLEKYKNVNTYKN